MSRFNLLPWLFAALLWPWGSLMYEQRMQLQGEVQQLRQKSIALQEHLTAQANQRTLEQAEYTRSRQRSVTLLAEISELEQQLTRLRTEVAFYRQVMEPAHSAGGVIVDQLQLEPMLSPGHYRLRIILMQQARRRPQLEGRIKLEISGSRQQQPARLAWSDVNLSDVDDELGFSFRYFQILEGEFLLPPQFQPEGIELSLFVDRPRSAKAERQLRYDWQQVIAEGSD